MTLSGPDRLRPRGKAGKCVSEHYLKAPRQCLFKQGLVGSKRGFVLALGQFVFVGLWLSFCGLLSATIIQHTCVCMCVYIYKCTHMYMYMFSHVYMYMCCLPSTRSGVTSRIFQRCFRFVLCLYVVYGSFDIRAHKVFHQLCSMCTLVVCCLFTGFCKFS